MRPEEFLIPSQADLENESVVLCGMLRDSTAASELSEALTAEDFSAVGGLLFGAIIEAWQEGRGRKVDPEIVLRKWIAVYRESEEKCREKLIEILEADPSASAWQTRSQLVRERSLRRQTIQAAQDSIAECLRPTTAAEDAVSAAQARFMRIGSGAVKNGTVSFAAAVREVNEAIDAGSSGDGIAGGLDHLDALTGGFHDGELCILAARPGVGKSALAVNLATNAARRGVPGLIISLEMSRRELATRYLCGLADVQSQHLRKGRLSHDQIQRLVQAGHQASALPLWINDTATLRSRDIRGIARKSKAATGTRLVVVDYLQLISPEDSRQGRVDQVGEISRSLKLLARDLELPVICLAQLNRQVDSRADGKPKLSDLRESGSIEQDADTVIFLYRMDGESTEHNPVETIGAYVAKQRNGPIGTVQLAFRKATMTFETMERMPTL